jgi:long-subunit fatty acid transport protein
MSLRIIQRATLVAVVALGMAARAGRAAPLDDPFVGGLGFNGPTAANLGSVYWNPAALGLVRGVQIMVAGTTRVSTTTVRRTGVDVNGIPSSSLPPLPTATAHDVTHPLQWPPGPGAFIAISTDVGGDRFTLGFATYEPYVEQNHFSMNVAGSDPTRYHRIDADLRNLALVPALSIRFGGDFRIGVAPGFLFSTGRLTFAEQTSPMGGENPATDARYDVNSGQSISDARFSVTLGGGIYWRRKTFEFGLAYSSRPIGTDVGGIEVAADKTQVTLPNGNPVTCASGQANRCVFGDIVYRLPDVWIAGVAWHPRPGLEIAAMARWIWFHLQDRIDIRLTSPALQAGLPDHITFHRGLKDVWDTRVRVAYWIRERLRLGAAMRIETSAVSPADVNPAAVDGFKIQPMVMVELRVTRGLSLTGGYGFTYMPDVTAHPSSFNPTAAGDCVASPGSNDLSKASCTLRQQGLARPTADGTYGRTEQDFSLAMNIRF